MKTRRRFFRAKCRLKSKLEYKGQIFQGNLENISLNGALIRVRENLPARPGEVCRLSVYLEENREPVNLVTEIVHIGFSIVGMRFKAMDEQCEKELFEYFEKYVSSTENMSENLYSIRVEEG